MLHPIPDSSLRDRLFAVLDLQKRLLARLCRLPERTQVDLAWLQQTWPHEPADWTRRFWKNDNGKRATWCQTVAAAAVTDKRTILSRCREHLRYAQLYQTGSTFRLVDEHWQTEPFASVKHLLTAFYAPLFYEREGYHEAAGESFHKDRYLAALSHQPKVCPYADGDIQLLKLDHFLPKDRFPILSCHPDNLIPCSTDANSGQLKGAQVPLDMAATDQARNWFHPRLRPAATGQGSTHQAAFTVTFDISGQDPRVVITAADPSNDQRVANVVRLFGLADFWCIDIDDEVKLIAGDIADELRDNHIAVDEQAVHAALNRKHSGMARRIGRESKAIVKTAFIAYVAATPSLFNQVQRTCAQGI